MNTPRVNWDEETVYEGRIAIMEQGHEQGYAHYHVDLPYPQVLPGRDPCAAALLMEDYSGITSELSAITQYFYASTRMRGHCDAVYNAMKYIAVVEMHHLDLLSQAITAKGGDPRYVLYGGRKPEQFWNADVIEYGKSRSNILLESIESEEAAISQYQCHIHRIPDESVKALLRRIIMDEEVHLQTFKDLYCQFEA